MDRRRDVRGRLMEREGGSFRNVPIFGQTDKETRTDDKIPVIVLPARRTIVNVYRLLPKGKASISKILGKKGGKITQVAASVISGREPARPVSEVFRTQINESSIETGKEIDGIPVNIFGLPVYDTKKYPKGDARATSQYNSLATQFVKKQVEKENPDPLYIEYARKLNVLPKRLREQVQEKSTKQTAEEEKKKQEIKRAAHMSATEKEFAESKKEHKDDVDWILWDIARKNRIPSDTNESYVVLDSTYRKYNSIDDFALIKRYIEYAKANKLLKGTRKDAPIIAIQPTLSKPPIAYYVNELVRTYARKKKHTITKVKRLLKLPKLAFRKKGTTQKKRKVIVKRKSGRR